MTTNQIRDSYRVKSFSPLHFSLILTHSHHFALSPPLSITLSLFFIYLSHTHTTHILSHLYYLSLPLSISHSFSSSLTHSLFLLSLAHSHLCHTKTHTLSFTHTHHTYSLFTLFLHKKHLTLKSLTLAIEPHSVIPSQYPSPNGKNL